mmetsp:Transcript_7705/g.25216  ORF Transcript_7705/g.25216 Transcript_7705/m.25216 type:complete len:434 (-) Transcript_7705:8-1309(-)
MEILNAIRGQALRLAPGPAARRLVEARGRVAREPPEERVRREERDEEAAALRGRQEADVGEDEDDGADAAELRARRDEHAEQRRVCGRAERVAVQDLPAALVDVAVAEELLALVPRVAREVRAERPREDEREDAAERQHDEDRVADGEPVHRGLLALRVAAGAHVDVPARRPGDVAGLEDDVVGVDDAGLEVVLEGPRARRRVARHRRGLGARRERAVGARAVVHGEGLREDADDARVARRRRVVLDDDLRVVVDVVLAFLHVADGHAPRVRRLAVRARRVLDDGRGRQVVDDPVHVVLVADEALDAVPVQVPAARPRRQLAEHPAVRVLEGVDLVGRVLDAVAREELAEVLLDVEDLLRLAEVELVGLVGHLRLRRREGVDLEPDALAGGVVLDGDARQVPRRGAPRGGEEGEVHAERERRLRGARRSAGCP